MLSQLLLGSVLATSLPQAVMGASSTFSVPFQKVNVPGQTILPNRRCSGPVSTPEFDDQVCIVVVSRDLSDLSRGILVCQLDRWCWEEPPPPHRFRLYRRVSQPRRLPAKLNFEEPAQELYHYVRDHEPRWLWD